MRDGVAFRLNPAGGLPTDVWSLPCAGTAARHYAAFPPQLIRPMIEAFSSPGDLVLDCFAGSGTTGAVAVKLGRRFLGIELNPDFAEMARAAVELARQPTITAA